jgi:hypothetical protein
MPLRRLVALLVVSFLALPASALAHIRLTGQFTMTGRITVAHDVPGEHVGEPVTRLWTFVAPCPAGQCLTEKLVRDRAMGEDTETLAHRFGTFNHWAGTGSFYAPLRCGSRIYRRGERVWFRITVRIATVAIVNAEPFATSVTATYTNYRRTNRTRCVAALGHDAAVYTGTQVTPAPVTPAPEPAQPGPTPALG